MVNDIKVIEKFYKGENGYRDLTLYVPVLRGKHLAVAARSYDMALLLGLERKYLGHNNNFSCMAGRMLGIKDEWTAFTDDPSLGD